MKIKPKYLYHGSGRRLRGDKLIPKKAKELDKKNKHNDFKGIYASDVKNEAIAMGILKSRGVKDSSCGFYTKHGIKVEAVIYWGWPEQKCFYLYTLPAETFENKPRGSHQWISFKSIKPIRIEKLIVKDYIYLIRKATKLEKKNWIKKYGKGGEKDDKNKKR
ncbi:MAG: hypothetical protein AABX26_02315 [Nanoarchaeota archaeon]